jgi:hypothetical protein
LPHLIPLLHQQISQISVNTYSKQLSSKTATFNMKFQAAALFVMATSAAASPMVDVHIKSASAGVAKAGVGTQATCFRVCWEDVPQCPDNWVYCFFAMYYGH